MCTSTEARLLAAMRGVSGAAACATSAAGARNRAKRIMGVSELGPGAAALQRGEPAQDESAHEVRDAGRRVSRRSADPMRDGDSHTREPHSVDRKGVDAVQQGAEKGIVAR